MNYLSRLYNLNSAYLKLKGLFAVLFAQDLVFPIDASIIKTDVNEKTWLQKHFVSMLLDEEA